MSEPTPDVTADLPGSELDLITRHRTLVSLGLHGALVALSLFFSFGLAYNFHYLPRWFWVFYLPLLAIALPIKLAVFVWTRQHRCSWRYVGLRDLLGVISASYIASFGLLAAYFLIENFWAHRYGHRLIDRDLEASLPQSVFLLDWAGTIGFVAMARVVVRLYHEEYGPARRRAQDVGSRLLIIGAGDAGEVVLREILRMRGERYLVVGFLDDEPSRSGNRIHGVEVLGRTDRIKAVCEKHKVNEILIAQPKVSPREYRRLVELCQGANVRFRTVPAVSALIAGKVEVSLIRAVEIEDLLGREQVQLDKEAIGAVLAGERIAVTGAGGSIGSEMCRQIARFGPERLILIEQAENALFEIATELSNTYPDLDVVPYVADIGDAVRVRAVLAAERPRVLYHAAAHKHVPMMEHNPGEAIKNNIIGTRTVADAAIGAGVEKMVMISTDKAVNPTSVMGCTKRVAEMYVQQLSDLDRTQFVTVRFGNVLGSSGSVVPIFKAQIARGGPVTVTHPEMRRYFMTIPEAAQLVLQAGIMGRGGEIFVLDMGEPVKIVDLARDMITLSGLRPDLDIDIEFTGIRPGEKLFEELSVEGEDFSSTQHPKIAIWRKRPEDRRKIREGIERLAGLADIAGGDEIRLQLLELVPEYQYTPPAVLGVAADLAPAG